jgi:transcription antitermination factor NusG
MGLKSSLKKGLKKKNRSINKKVRICVECGSIRVVMNEKNIACLDCGVKRKFKKTLEQYSIKKGDHVKIIELEYSNTIYKIKKLKKSEDGTKLYLLKSESSPISLLYYESEDSHLEKVN